MLRADFDGNHEALDFFDPGGWIELVESFQEHVCTSQESNLVTDSTLANTSASVRAPPVYTADDTYSTTTPQQLTIPQ